LLRLLALSSGAALVVALTWRILVTVFIIYLAGVLTGLALALLRFDLDSRLLVKNWDSTGRRYELAKEGEAVKVIYDKPAEQDLVLLNVPAGRVFEFKGGIPSGQFLRTRYGPVSSSYTAVAVHLGTGTIFTVGDALFNSQVRLLDAELVIKGERVAMRAAQLTGASFGLFNLAGRRTNMSFKVLEAHTRRQGTGLRGWLTVQQPNLPAEVISYEEFTEQLALGLLKEIPSA
jgi:hypothetical protein